MPLLDLAPPLSKAVKDVLPYILLTKKGMLHSRAAVSVPAHLIHSISLLFLQIGISFPGQVVLGAKATLFLLREVTDVTRKILTNYKFTNQTLMKSSIITHM